MWLPRGGNSGRKAGGNGFVAVAIDRDKGSQHALKWAIENLLSKGQTVILIHVIHRPSTASLSGNNATVSDIKGATSAHRQQMEKQTKDLFLTFHCFCTRKDIQSFDVILEDVDIVKAITEYVSYAAIETLVLGASSRHGFIRRFKTSDIPSHVSKGAPDFSTVYVISKTKISSVRKASRSAPFTSPLRSQIKDYDECSDISSDARSRHSLSIKLGRTPRKSQSILENNQSMRSPFTRGRRAYGKLGGDFSESDTDISFVSSGRPSTDRMSYNPYNPMEVGRMSTSSDHMGAKWNEISSLHEFSSASLESGRTSTSSQSMDEMEAEMRRLKLELKQTMDMYSTACREALTAKQKAMALEHLQVEEERKSEEARLAEKAAQAISDKEKVKSKAATETAEAAQRIAELESQHRLHAEMKILQDAEEKKPVVDKFALKNVWYRRYTIEEIEMATEYFAESRKIGEGGYGPVFKCHLDHTPVAVKVLRPDAAQGREQFQQEVEVLSCMRHPNMVILVGACPEYGCLVYEYMANGSLDDRLFQRENTPPLSWQLRFRIAAEIATGLLFLHQTKPEPLVHRDLKPGNILLDHNFVSKISDVGLSRLVPPSITDDITQYRMTSTAGTFCYIDPEYQQTGMLGVKSDVYSLGIMLLQLITAKPAMGLTHLVGQAIEKGTFAEMLDPSVTDWPVEEALCLAKLSLQCAELRRKDRPDVGKVVLPELNRLRDLARENFSDFKLCGSANPSPNQSQVSKSQDVISDPQLVQSGPESVISNSSSSSLNEKLSGTTE